MDKIRVLDEVKSINTEMFLTSFEKASRLLLEQKEKLEKQGWTSLHLKNVYYHNWVELCVYGMREETDEEFEIRQKEEERKIKKQQQKEERERKKLAELQAKYGREA